MKLVEVENYQEMSEAILECFKNQIIEKPASVLSFTTGKTPQEFLMKLADSINEGLDISQCVFLNLDEYVGKRNMAYSVYSFMHRCLYDRISTRPKVVDMMNAEALDYQEELKRYGKVLKKYPRDIQLLGLGTNGHIGANEPGTSFDSTLFVADSYESTIKATRELFGLKEEETPTQMFTMGFREIMEAEHVILAASGKSKAWAVKELVEGEITETLPASFLKKHKNFTLIIDREAGSLLNRDKWNILSTWKMSLDGVKHGIEILQKENNIHKAIVEAVKKVENESGYVSVGYGGLPNRDGEVELDAAYMNGDTLQAGGIMAVHNIKNPVEVAFELSKQKRNCFLAGTGAEKFAAKNQFAFCNMLTPASKKRYDEAIRVQSVEEEQEAYKGHDTVCVIGKNCKGSMGCGVSTSGLFLKHPGRVGDSPVIGSGFYAVSQIGAAAATGVGEDIMRGCLSYAIVNMMENGVAVQQACEKVLNSHIRTLESLSGTCGSMSVIAMDKDGNIGAATNLDFFPFVAGSVYGDVKLMGVRPKGDRMIVFEPDEKWLQQHTCD